MVGLQKLFGCFANSKTIEAEPSGLGELQVCVFNAELEDILNFGAAEPCSPEDPMNIGSLPSSESAGLGAKAVVSPCQDKSSRTAGSLAPSRCQTDAAALAQAERAPEELPTPTQSSAIHKCGSAVSLADTAYEAHSSMDRTCSTHASIALAFSSKLYSVTCPKAAAPLRPRRPPPRRMGDTESSAPAEVAAL